VVKLYSCSMSWEVRAGLSNWNSFFWTPLFAFGAQVNEGSGFVVSIPIIPVQSGCCPVFLPEKESTIYKHVLFKIRKEASSHFKFNEMINVVFCHLRITMSSGN